MAQILPSTSPFVGAVAIFQYKEKHIALVTKLDEKGFYIKESNYIAGKYGTRFIPWNDPKLVGFYTTPSLVEIEGEP